MPQHKRPAGLVGPTAKEMNIGELLGTGVTKSALVKIIQSLHRTGFANVTMSRTTIKRWLPDHARAQTPHGSVVQSMKVGSYNMEFIHPAALLHYLCSISNRFSAAMESANASAGGGACHVFLYSDAATPGNPFRPDKGRKFEAFYWCVAEWPDHILQRSMCWATLCLVRSSIVDTIPGGLSLIFSKLLQVFDVLSSGILLPGVTSMSTLQIPLNT